MELVIVSETPWSPESTVSTYIGRCMLTTSHGVTVRLTFARVVCSQLRFVLCGGIAEADERAHTRMHVSAQGL